MELQKGGNEEMAKWGAWYEKLEALFQDWGKRIKTSCGENPMASIDPIHVREARDHLSDLEGYLRSIIEQYNSTDAIWQSEVQDKVRRPRCL